MIDYFTRRGSRDSVLPPAYKNHLNNLFREIEEEFSHLYLENVRQGFSTQDTSVAEPPPSWAAPAPEGQDPGADSGSDLLGWARAPGKKRRLQAAPAPYTNIFHFKLSKS